MKTRRPLSTPGLALLVGMMGGMVWGGAAALADSNTTTRAVPIKGKLVGQPETVFFSGTAQVTSTLVPDPTFGTPPGVILSVNLQNIAARGVTGQIYVARSEQLLIRQFVPRDLVEIHFPVFPDSAGGGSLARSALWSFKLAYDVNTGALTGARGKVRKPRREFPSL